MNEMLDLNGIATADLVRELRKREESFVVDAYEPYQISVGGASVCEDSGPVVVIVVKD